MRIYYISAILSFALAAGSLMAIVCQPSMSPLLGQFLLVVVMIGLLVCFVAMMSMGAIWAGTWAARLKEQIDNEGK